MTQRKRCKRNGGKRLGQKTVFVHHWSKKGITRDDLAAHRNNFSMRIASWHPRGLKLAIPMKSNSFFVVRSPCVRVPGSVKVTKEAKKASYGPRIRPGGAEGQARRLPGVPGAGQARLGKFFVEFKNVDFVALPWGGLSCLQGSDLFSCWPHVLNDFPQYVMYV